MHDEWLRVASDGFVARLPGGAHAQEHGLRPLPVRPRRDDGNELVEHGARSSSFVVVFFCGSRVDRRAAWCSSSLGWRWIFKIGRAKTPTSKIALGKTDVKDDAFR